MATKQITLTLSEKLYDEIVQAKQEEATTSTADFIRKIISEKLEENRKRVGGPMVFVKTQSDA